MRFIPASRRVMVIADCARCPNLKMALVPDRETNVAEFRCEHPRWGEHPHLLDLRPGEAPPPGQVAEWCPLGTRE